MLLKVVMLEVTEGCWMLLGVVVGGWEFDVGLKLLEVVVVVW